MLPNLLKKVENYLAGRKESMVKKLPSLGARKKVVRERKEP